MYEWGEQIHSVHNTSLIPSHTEIGSTSGDVAGYILQEADSSSYRMFTGSFFATDAMKWMRLHTTPSISHWIWARHLSTAEAIL